jgi:hypothetical protein
MSGDSDQMDGGTMATPRVISQINADLAVRVLAVLL